MTIKETVFDPTFNKHHTPASQNVPLSSHLDITSSHFHANPFPLFQRLRDDAPVHAVKLPDGRIAWLVSRYEDVNNLLSDKRFVKRPRNVASQPGDPPIKEMWVPAFLRPLSNNMLDMDGNDHTRLRELVHRAFTPKLVEQMRQQAETIANDLIDKSLAKGRFDLISDFALPLPVTIISIMLGVPEADRHKFSRWSNKFIGLTSSWEMLSAIPSMWRFLRYIRGLVDLRRNQPGDDLITALVQAEATGDRLSADEVLAMVMLLLIAGHETTVTLISSGMAALLQDPEQYHMLRNDPRLIKSGVEELLRFTSPVSTATERYAAEEVTIAGVTIPRGSLVLALLASANHDERRFEQPERLDLLRANNRHLAFGQGVHYCLGAPLARLEGQIAINLLLERMPNLRLAAAPQAIQWRKSLFVHAMKSLPVNC